MRVLRSAVLRNRARKPPAAKKAPRDGMSRRALNGTPSRARTSDPLIKSQLLCQLSYAPHLSNRV